MRLQLSDISKDPATCLLVVDMQPDFYPTGALPVAKGDEIIPKIAHWAEIFQNVVFTQDSHPEIHISFASSYPGKKAFEILSLEEVDSGAVSSPHFSQEEVSAYLKKTSQKSQVLWPDHCVVGTPGWELDKRLPLQRGDLILRKGRKPEVDSYSGFYENDGSSTGLGAFLRDRGIKRVVTCGLAGDYCVYWTAKDAIREGFQVVYDESVTRHVGFPVGSVERALDDLKARGAKLVSLD